MSAEAGGGGERAAHSGPIYTRRVTVMPVSRPAAVVIVQHGVLHLLPDVRRAAMAAAGGDALRIEVRSPTEAVVHNDATWRSAATADR